jgi:exopolysaccharide biosynthesis polyprenyl glycosylphosphotransferase
MQRPALTTLGSGLKLFDLAALIVGVPLAIGMYQRVGEHPWIPPVQTLWPALLLVVLLWAAIAWMNRLYDAPFIRAPLMDAMRLFQTLAMVAGGLFAVAFMTKQHDLSRLLVGLYFAFTFSLAIAGRLGWRAIVRTIGRGGSARRYAVVGAGAMAREVVESVEAHPEWGLRFAGFIRPDGTEERSRLPSLGVLSDIGLILDEEVVDVVVFAVPREILGKVERAVHLCEEQGVEVRISLDILRFGPGRMTVADMDGIPMLAFTRTPSDAIALAAKRVFDFAVSGVMLLLLAPLLAGIAIAIRLDSPGPVLFRQRRAGQSGRTFHMLKFRSMYLDAEQRLEALRAMNEMSGPVFKMANDPRVTPVGRFLRKTSLDELPQFWNVLTGDMSIVGPRPPIPAEVRQYRRWQRRRLSMKPGITCIWQISGRNNIDFDQWMELDLQYIDHWSLWMDFQICAKTIPAVLSARGAH